MWNETKNVSTAAYETATSSYLSSTFVRLAISVNLLHIYIFLFAILGLRSKKYIDFVQRYQMQYFQIAFRRNYYD